MGLFDIDGPSLFGDEPKKKKSTKNGRDKRRAFTKTQKNEILHQQNMKCAKCKNKLDPRAIDFDHKKPWADKGRTVTENGRALCKNCHGIVTHKTNLKKVDKKKKERMVTVKTFGGTEKIPISQAEQVTSSIIGKKEWRKKGSFL